MAKKDAHSDPRNESIIPSTNRRDFLKLPALGAVSAVAPPVFAADMADRVGVGNSMPGRIVICHDPDMRGHYPAIDYELVEQRVAESVRILTGISDAVAETIVDLGIDWSGIKTLGDLQTGLRAALATVGMRIEG